MILLVGTLLLPILCDPFGMVKWKAKWPPNRGWKGHFESPGCCFFPTKRFLLIKYFGLDNNRYLTTRWLNQPFCKICESQIGNLPQTTVNMKKYLKPPRYISATIMQKLLDQRLLDVFFWYAQISDKNWEPQVFFSCKASRVATSGSKLPFMFSWNLKTTRLKWMEMVISQAIFHVKICFFSSNWFPSINKNLVV